MRFSSVYQLFSHSSSEYTQKPFLYIPASECAHYSPKPVDYTYQQMQSELEQVKTVYQAAGYGIGHRVALMLENRAEFFIHWFALNALGVSVVPVNSQMQQDEQCYLLDHSDSCLWVVLADDLDAAMSTAQSLDIKVISSEQIIAQDFASKDLAALSALQTQLRPDQTIDSQTECAMLFTSGSTGKPKGCLLSNEYFLEFADWYRTIGGLLTLELGSERLLTPLPLVHMNAMAVSSMGMIATGGCLIQLNRFSASKWWDTVKQSKATCLHYLGVLPAILLNLPERDDDLNAQIKFGFGAGCNPKHHEKFEQRFGFPLIESWAMSECGSGGCITAFEEPRYVGSSCFGAPDPKRVEYRLVDEQGNDVGDGEPGELLVRRVGDDPRKGFFSGYYKNPEATQEAWQDGWLHTGDVVRLNEQGYMHFVDRRKNVIRRSGENIAALEVEAALVHCEQIDQVVVTAVPDEIRGDEVLAMIILPEDAQADLQCAQQIFDFAMRQLAYYKAPGYIAFVNELPLTASQKPQRAEIKKLAVQLVSDLAKQTADATDSAVVYDMCKQKRPQDKR